MWLDVPPASPSTPPFVSTSATDLFHGFLGRVCVSTQGEPLLNSGAAGFVLSRASLSLLRGAWGQVPPSASHSNLQQEQGGEGGTEGGLGSERREGEGGRGGSGEVLAGCVATSKFERSNPGGWPRREKPHEKSKITVPAHMP